MKKLSAILAFGSILELCVSIAYLMLDKPDKALVYGIYAILFHLWAVSP